MKEKKKLVFNDYVVFFDKCNFRCDYCLNKLRPNETDIWKQTEQDVSKEVTTVCGKELVYEGDVKDIIERTVNQINEDIDTPILRISGGEILAIKNIEEFFEKYHEKYEVIQIVTNGYYLVPTMVEKLKKLGNIHIHFSLDGHTLELNYYRVKTQVVQERLVNNLKACIDARLNVEISSVLTNQNTMHFASFLDYLLRYSNKLIVLPAPVRGGDFVQYFPTKEDVAGFYIVLDKYEQYRSILPPKRYIIELINFMEGKLRGTACHVPRVAIQSIENGAITPCPNGWTLQLGNVLAENRGEIAEKIGNSSIYNVLLQKRPRIKYCKECFTAYDVINLFFNNQITLEELCRFPLYASPRVYQRLVDIKKMYEQSDIY